MYNTTDIEIIRDNGYRKRCIIRDPLDKREFLTITFNRNDFNIIFIYIDEEIRSILIPQSLIDADDSIVDEIIRVHPTVPIFYYNNFDIESFVKGIIFVMASKMDE
jgi:hypothetical protein